MLAKFIKVLSYILLNTWWAKYTHFLEIWSVKKIILDHYYIKMFDLYKGYCIMHNLLCVHLTSENTIFCLETYRNIDNIYYLMLLPHWWPVALHLLLDAHICDSHSDTPHTNPLHFQLHRQKHSYQGHHHWWLHCE